MNKAKLNYWVDLAIALAFMVSGMSGLVFLLPVEWASIRADGLPQLLGLTLLAWSDLHTYSSLALLAGVAGHLVLHARWIRQMTKCTFGAKGKASVRARGCDGPEDASLPLTHGVCTRRAFLRTAGWSMVAVLGAGAAYIGTRRLTAPTSASASAPSTTDVDTPAPTAKSHAAANLPEATIAAPSASGSESLASTSSAPSATAAPTEAAPSTTPTLEPTATPTEEPESVTVRCPRGIVYDPYPGRCRMYVDSNGDGYCDYSEPLEG